MSEAEEIALLKMRVSGLEYAVAELCQAASMLIGTEHAQRVVEHLEIPESKD